jgi:aminoglycoside/choline kinase family phosphotransferase
MASAPAVTPMIPPVQAPAFLAANGWEGAQILPLAGDASFRRYFRVHRGNETAVLMDAPPGKEDLGPFLTVAEHLLARGFAPPRPLAVDRALGLLLLDDFGDDRVAPLLLREPARERETYDAAVDIAVRLAKEAAPKNVARYDAAVLRREADLFVQWYAPALGLDVDVEAWHRAWDEAWAGVLAETERHPVLVLRDYHADNLMVVPGLDQLGLLDFQDALAGHPAYDLVSLLQDARRDVSPELQAAMLDRFMDGSEVEDRETFRAHYEVLGAQRNAKILGIFTRLWKRDGKPAYPTMHPRIWTYVERNLAHPALAGVRAWFDSNVPQSARGDAVAKLTK